MSAPRQLLRRHRIKYGVNSEAIDRLETRMRERRAVVERRIDQLEVQLAGDHR